MGVLPSIESYQGIWAAICLRGRCFCVLGLTEIDWHHWHASKLINVQVRLERQDLAAIDRQAAAAGTNRSALIRQRAIVAEYQQGLYALTPTAYHALVSDAAAFMGGVVPRQHVELLTAYVITRLDSHHSQAVARHQPSS